MAARKPAVEVAEVVEQPPEPLIEELPVQPVGKRYVAGRRMQRDGQTIKVGDEIPDAGSWKRLESWIRTGYVKEA